jgi:hypothetical protein
VNQRLLFKPAGCSVERPDSDGTVHPGAPPGHQENQQKAHALRAWAREETARAAEPIRWSRRPPDRRH